MGKGTVISDFGQGYYQITLKYGGRAENEARIEVLNEKIAELQNEYDAMPETTPEERFDKNIVGLQIAALERRVAILNSQFPADPTIYTWSIDGTEGLTGDVGILEIPGEYESPSKVNIVAGYNGGAAWNQARDGQITPSLGLGPWVTFLNKCMLPGWQKFDPIYRYGTIISDSMDYENDTCDICLEPEFSSQQNLPVNQGQTFSDCKPTVWPQFTDFCSRNPTHPTCTNTEPGAPTFISDAQFETIKQTNANVNAAHEYETDLSGYGAGDYWDIMTTGQRGDCEDFALTKMQELINAGYPVKNLQMAIVAVEGTTVANHAVLMIQTVNRGTLILDNRFDEVRQASSLPYRFLDYQRAGQDWQTVSTKLTAVPIEYQFCNSTAFTDGDEVVIKFEGQDFNQPKVVGFRSNPAACFRDYYIFFGYHDCLLDYGPPIEAAALPNHYQYKGNTDSWQELAYVLPVSYPNDGYWSREYVGYSSNQISSYWVFGGSKPARTVQPPASLAQPYPYNTFHEVVDNAHRYDKAAFSWTDRQAVPNEKRSDMAGFYINGHTHLIGGTQWQENNIEPLCEVYSTHDRYNDISDSYESKAGYKSARTAYWTLNELAYIFGGNPVNLNSWNEYDPANFVDTLKAYDPTTNSYQTKASGAVAWSGFGANFSIGSNKGYAFGGRTTVEYTSRLDEYNADLNIWTSKQSWFANSNGKRPSLGVSNYAYVWATNYPAWGVYEQHQQYKQNTDTWLLIGETPNRNFGRFGAGTSK